MRISAYHKALGDNVEWWQTDFKYYDKVYMSKIFSDAYSPDIQEPINCGEVIKGGTGYSISLGSDGKERFDKENHKNLPPEIEKMFPDYSIYPQEIRQLQRWCNSKFIFKSCKNFEDYQKE